MTIKFSHVSVIVITLGNVSRIVLRTVVCL